MTRLPTPPAARAGRLVRRAAVGLALATTVATAATVPAAAQTDPPPADGAPFTWVEATIDDIHAALDAGTITCRGVVQGYLDRIAAYDDVDVDLGSVIAVSPTALAEADALDAADATGADRGALHCVPVLLKDNVDAAGMITTAGATALDTASPPDDAFITAQTRAAGGIILGKANLDEFAFGFTGSSSVEGLTRNPYDPTRGAGGSSSGTGASIAASLATVGIGTDTGGSIRVPSSVGGLVGIRPSMRLLSQDGIVPLAHFQDTAGPMCRTVIDCARYLSVLVGHDTSGFSGQNTLPLQRDDVAVLVADAAQYHAIIGTPGGHRYDLGLPACSLDGVRIGVVRDLFGSNVEVVAAMDRAIARMRAAGATVEDTTIPELSTVTGYSSVSRWEFRDHLTEYLQSWPSTEDGHPQSFEAVVASGGYENDSTVSLITYFASGLSRYDDPDYETNTMERPAVARARVTAGLDNTELDGTVNGDAYAALLYPSVLTPPRVGSAPSTGSNNRLSPFTGYPALTMPAGFTAPTADTPALPVGMELLGREFDESTLLCIAAAYESAAAGTSDARQAPTFTPELEAPDAVVPEFPLPAATVLLVGALAVLGARLPAGQRRGGESFAARRLRRTR